MTDTATETTTFELGDVGVMCTRRGLNVLSAGLTGERILFSRVAIGDGRLNVATREEYNRTVLNMTEMVNWQMDLPIAECKNLGNGYMMLHVTKNNAEVPEGFFARERGVYAIDQQTGQEILYAYINTGDASSFIPSNTGPVSKIIDFSVYTVIQNASKVEVILDASFAYVGLQRFLDHVQSDHPHKNTPNFYGKVSDADRFWVTNFDNNLYQISVDNVKDILLSEVNEKLAENQRRIKELETVNQAKNELGLDANLMVVEDFNPATEIDNVMAKVISCARGGRLIGVENVEDIIVGRQYWIADGVNQEIVQIKGVAYSTDYYHVQLERALTYDYLDKVYLYRTTFTNESADSKSISWSGKSFKGIAANISRTLTLDTSQAFTIEGDGILTQDGYFSLTQDYGILGYGGSATIGGSTDTSTADCDHNCECCSMSDTCTMRGAS